MRIAIVGCGIAGLSSALVLSRLGHNVRIFERFPEARPLGAGFLLQPSGQEVLDRLGLLDETLSRGARVDRLYGRTSKGRSVLDIRYTHSGKPIFGLGLHRAALFDILHRAVLEAGVPIELDSEVEAIVSLHAPTLVLSRRREVGPFDLVIIAEGSHSELREHFMPRARAPLYPWGALWTVCTDPTGRFAGTLNQVYRGSNIMIGVLPITATDVAFFWSVEHHRFDEWRSQNLGQWKQEVTALWPDTAPLLECIDEHSDLAEATYRDVVMQPWSRGHVVFIGDAAHGTSPQLGQGANLALIDSMVLGHVIATMGGDPERIEKMLRRFEKMRWSQVTYYRIASRLLTPVFQSKSRVIGWTRDTFTIPLSKLPLAGAMMRRTLIGRGQIGLKAWQLPKTNTGKKQ